jgi:hypothetical protein
VLPEKVPEALLRPERFRTMTDRSLAIRLAVIDGGKVKVELRDVGDAGGRQLQSNRTGFVALAPGSRRVAALCAATSMRLAAAAS